jgi:RNA polymerase sigma-70 factor (ECF subfamily)
MDKAGFVVEETLDLVDRALKGSREAFSGLILLHHGRVRAFIARHIRKQELVDDLAQDTFLWAYRSLASYRGEASFRVWLLAIARNVTMTYLRREHRAPQEVSLGNELAEWLAHDLESPSVDHDRELSAIQDCLRELPEQNARLVRDFYFKGRTAGYIARKTGRSEGGLWVTLLRIRRALRQCMEVRLRSGEAV